MKISLQLGKGFVILHYYVHFALCAFFFLLTLVYKSVMQKIDWLLEQGIAMLWFHA